ncbi:hypothetical protein Bca52824_088458 [Brassica carinata]|uniref:Uncharacterized protein n=1 Tax=Brassica carinata TaxID=52824 RepID=A0A8X7PCI9_BRACI|nr:hypothetical protein Bca52824_088458 [Brassica carinata]
MYRRLRSVGKSCSSSRNYSPNPDGGLPVRKLPEIIVCGVIFWSSQFESFIERLFLQIPWRCVEMEITEFDGNNCSGCGDAVVPKPITALGDDQIRLGGWRLGL